MHINFRVSANNESGKYLWRRRMLLDTTCYWYSEEACVDLCIVPKTVFNGTRVACRQIVNNEILRASRCGVRERGGERLCEYNSDFRGHKFVKYDFVRSKYFRKCDDRHTLSGHLLTFVWGLGTTYKWLPVLEIAIVRQSYIALQVAMA